jgi:hypothetical protein
MCHPVPREYQTIRKTVYAPQRTQLSPTAAFSLAVGKSNKALADAVGKGQFDTPAHVLMAHIASRHMLDGTRRYCSYKMSNYL